MWHEVTSGPLTGRRVNLALLGSLLVVETAGDFYVHASADLKSASSAQIDGPYDTQELAEAALDLMIA